jgi:reductive dehalogenase
MFAGLLILIDILIIAASLYFWYESKKEKEKRAPITGIVGAFSGLVVFFLIILLPELRIYIAVIFCFIAGAGVLCLIPCIPNQRALKGSFGFITGKPKKIDERDIVFARNRCLKPGSDLYKRYYRAHPEKEEVDAKRRSMGTHALGTPGLIDNCYRPNTSMITAGFHFPMYLGQHAEHEPETSLTSGSSPTTIDPHKASEIIKGFAKHLGASLVGICKVNPLWSYSHRGEIFFENDEDWGKELDEPLPFAVVIATEMNHELVSAGPHIPAVIESGLNYAKGSYITTILAHWFSAMGFKAVADHHRHYTKLLVPLAVDAGLGELGRQGYLIAKKYGPRVRLFAVTTDMPLIPDQPVDMGAEEFCKRCLKCAEACPSKSIPTGEKTNINGIKRWKLKEESCFQYWAKVGTDCSICMGVCPFSRPDTLLHQFVKLIITHSYMARLFFPYIDNIIYGKKWHAKSVSPWIDYKNKEDVKNE